MALLLNPDFESAKNNLEIAKKLQIDDIKVIEKVGIGQYLQNFVSLLHYDAWAWLAIGSGFLIFLFFLVYYFTETSIAKRLFFSAMLLAIVLLAATFSAAVYQKSYSISCRPAIVFAEVTPLLSTPQASAKTIAKLHEGVKVFVLASNNSFAKVQLTDNKIGWIAASAIKELKK